MPHMATPIQTLVQSVIKLSKLVKEARQLGCETFSSIVDIVAAKNWLKSVSNTLIVLELDDELKLRVTTRLIDKSTTTWLRSTALVTWDLFVQEFNE